MPIFLSAMVQKKVLQKLTDPELERYLREDSRFTPEAIKLAAEILEERGRIFTDDEKFRIRELIKTKYEEEERKKLEQEELHKDHITEDPEAIRLHSRELIMLFGLCLGFISGAILLSLNLFKLKKYREGAGIIFLGIAYSIIQYFGIQLMYEAGTSGKTTVFNRSPELLFAVTGFLLLYFLWLETLKKLPYRKNSLLVPVIIGLLSVFLSYLNYYGYSPSYLFVILAR
ncbi:hypothetical protein [uncultured Chryseobacterium sp.]|uniref:hypothetical protein n=1 Tax=uncultured Chryseobacterium sp. TaxID=259322 RepID=UPI0025E36D02|nr:hypothetical protein [uncultured Chryseobacterium sp.]